MPAKKRSSSGKKEAPKESQAATRRSTRGGSAANDSKSAATSKRKASPSPSPAPKRAASAKKGRTKSPSPPPNERPKRGRSTSKKEEPKPVEKPASRSASNQKGRVTRNVVQEEEVKKSTDSKSRSASRGAKSPAKSKGSAEPKNKTVTPKQKAEAPKLKKETPKQKAATQRGRSTTPKRAKETPKEIAVTPKQKSATPKQKPTPRQKQQTPKKKTEPVAKKTSLKSTPVKGNKPESPPKTTRSRRSRQGVEPDEKVCSEDDIETAEKNTDKTVEDETPEKEKPAEDSVAEAVDESKLEVNKTKEHTKDEPEEEIENTEQVEKIEEENEQRKGVEGKNETKDGEQALDNVEKGEESAKEDQEPEKDEQQKDEENENVEAMANENSEEADEKMETADADEVEQVGEEVCEISQLKTVQVVSGSNEGETAESKKAEQTADVEEVKANEDAEMTIDSTAVEIKIADLDKSIVDNVKSSETGLTEKTQVACGKPGDDLVKNDLSEKVEATKESAQGVIDFKKVSGEAVNIQTESNVANDLISAGETDYGSGDQEQPKKVTIVEEISDDDIEEIDTKQNNGAANEDNEDIEEIQFVEQVDKYVENSPTKRKIDDVDTELDDSSPVKKIRISTEEEIQENGSSSQEDIAKDYVVIEMGDVPQANSTEVQSSLPNPIFNRTFIPNPTFSGASDTSKQFSVVSYNMLADCHLFRNDYSFTEAKLLQPEYRLKKVIEEIRYLDGDIVCMQEVDPQFFTDQLLPTMRSQGYEGLHKQRADEYYNEGEATFFKNSRFDVVDTAASTFSELLQKELEGIEPAIQEAVKKYTNLPDVVIVAKLRCKNTGREVTIGNVHINWGEMKVPDAQCVQIASAVKEIVSKATGDNFPHIICGDFNSPPMSPGYLVARDGYPSGDETINTLMKIEGLELEDGKKASLVNSLWPAFQHTSSSLRSAYSEAQGYEPEISSYNRVMCDCVDYIFYSSMSLENVGVLQTASKEKVMETGGIPNCYFPSDHVSLKSVLSFK